MRLRLLRHATLLVQFGEIRLLVDPMLDPAGTRPAVPETPNPRPNPLVALPVQPLDAVAGVSATLVTHSVEPALVNQVSPLPNLVQIAPVTPTTPPPGP